MEHYNFIDSNFVFDTLKNAKLIEFRGISFEEIIEIIESKGPLDVFRHPNANKYPNQMVIAIEFKEYVYLVPFVEEKDKIILKTAFPCRKATRRYLYM